MNDLTNDELEFICNIIQEFGVYYQHNDEIEIQDSILTKIENVFNYIYTNKEN